ncbi:DUF3558 domain-containing protein [Rhodococcus sp. ABRD24]|uniref:DUF3558 domain-containing protein n=1 Tax=Rhodococcus sp. ABRD24 TaxID=2507582 RepID=UPI00103A9018|nr:DUF3558 domain-containing protein [Rhodococcus sp. ABRD24]QBJ95637.1 DUF3558 domain-containing protein [Rhodococcus sp. ABRD24]
MPIKLVGALTGIALLLAGCGSAADEPQAADGAHAVGAETRSAASAGPFFGECASVTDQEVAETFGVSGFGTVIRNSVGCEWQLAGPRGPHVAFSWYRGSPIDRERAGSDLIGRRGDDIEIAGRPGFVASAPNAPGRTNSLCEIGVGFGADFVHWSVTYGDTAPAADPCDVAGRLARLTVERGR